MRLRRGFARIGRCRRRERCAHRHRRAILERLAGRVKDRFRPAPDVRAGEATRLRHEPDRRGDRARTRGPARRPAQLRRTSRRQLDRYPYGRAARRRSRANQRARPASPRAHAGTKPPQRSSLAASPLVPLHEPDAPRSCVRGDPCLRSLLHSPACGRHCVTARRQHRPSRLQPSGQVCGSLDRRTGPLRHSRLACNPRSYTRTLQNRRGCSCRRIGSMSSSLCYRLSPQRDLDLVSNT